MSMNFYISGSREITVNKTGVVETQLIHYQPWQTPTLVTEKILSSSDPVEVYKDWVKSISIEEQENIYDDEDTFCENDPIGTKTINAGAEERDQVDIWINAVLELGYELSYYTL